MAYLDKNNKERIQEYIRKLDGISFHEWEHLRESMDHTMDCAITNWKKDSTLKICESAINRVCELQAIDLSYNYRDMTM